jgi:hypothetical protein
MAAYYRLDDIDIIAKQDGAFTYLFDHGVGGWVTDAQHILANRLTGEDGGKAGVFMEITQEEAQQAIGRAEDGVQQ